MVVKYAHVVRLVRKLITSTKMSQEKRPRRVVGRGYHGKRILHLLERYLQRRYKHSNNMMTVAIVNIVYNRYIKTFETVSFGGSGAGPKVKCGIVFIVKGGSVAPSTLYISGNSSKDRIAALTIFFWQVHVSMAPIHRRVVRKESMTCTISHFSAWRMKVKKSC